MKTLTSISPDILGLILYGRSSSYLLINLWLTGDRMLMDMLRRGVTYVHLSDFYQKSASTWPVVLSELRQLRYFSISRGRYSFKGAPLQVSAGIQRLPPSLTTLKLRFRKAESALFNFSLKAPYVTKSQYERGTSPMIDMNRYFPVLQALKIKDSASSQIAFADLAGLPDSLTLLSLRRLRIFFDDFDLRPLPHSLTAIHAKVVMYSDERSIINARLSKHPLTFDCLPPSLTYIKDVDCPYAEHLPAHINFPQHFSAFNTDAIRPCTTFISLSDALEEGDSDGPCWYSLLPSRLVRLDIGLGYNLTKKSVASLPRTLEYLGGFGYFGAHDLEEEMNGAKYEFSWPPRLETLEVYTPLADATWLPKTLKHLFIMHFEHWNPASLPAWNDLQTLMVSAPIASDHVATLFNALPTSLKVLSLECLGSQATPLATKMLVDNFDPTSIQRLSSLQHFCIDLWCLSWSSLLPRSITNLHISKLVCNPNELIFEDDSTDPFSQLPLGMRYLALRAVADPLEEVDDRKLPAASFSSLRHLVCLQAANFPKLPLSSWSKSLQLALMSAWAEESKETDDQNALLPYTFSTGKTPSIMPFQAWKSFKELEKCYYDLEDRG